MSDVTWSFDLFEPGMTSVHRAGMVGLLASLQLLAKEQDSLLPRLTIDGTRMVLNGVDSSMEGIHYLLLTLYRIEDGLISFPIFQKLSAKVRSDIQSILLNTFLQHGKSRVMNGDVKHVGDEEEKSYSYRPLASFNHQSANTAKIISDSMISGKSIPVAGWAIPGAVAKHIAHNSQTTWEDSPERFLLLMCAPLGCLYYKASSVDAHGDWDKHTQSVIVVPQVNSLKQQSERLQDYYGEREQQTSLEVVSGVSDAALLGASVCMGINQFGRDQGMNLYVMRFGNVPWSSQQKTRTGAVTAVIPDEETYYRCNDILVNISNRQAISKDGKSYVQVMPMRERIAENLLHGQPWYLGLHEFMSGKRRLLLDQKIWREGMRRLVERTDTWDSDVKRKFVELMQKAVNNRYGKVSNKAMSSGSDVRTALQKESDKIVLSFQHSRTREALRETVMQFVAWTKPKISDGSANELTEREILMKLFFDSQIDWREVRDLCSLAIATYRGSYAEKLVDGNLQID